MTGDREPMAYTAEEAGLILGGKSAEWMMTEAREGRIGYSKVGRDTMFLPDHLLAYLRANEVKPTRALTSRPPARRRSEPSGIQQLESRPPKRRGAAA